MDPDPSTQQPIEDASVESACNSITLDPEKASRGIAYWSLLELEDSFRAIGLNDSQIIQLKNDPSPDKTHIIQRLLDELSKATLEDGLTHVYNRRYFERSLCAEIERSRRDQRPCGLVLLDIDHFKSFNDNHGHDVGDQVLKLVAATIKSVLRSTDTVSRIGGEEFAIIVPNTFRLDAQYLAERIRRAVSEISLDNQGEVLKVTASLGVVIAEPRKDISVEDIYKQADNALYEAKDSGRNCTRFFTSENQSKSSAVTVDERNELLG